MRLRAEGSCALAPVASMGIMMARGDSTESGYEAPGAVAPRDGPRRAQGCRHALLRPRAGGPHDLPVYAGGRWEHAGSETHAAAPGSHDRAAAWGSMPTMQMSLGPGAVTNQPPSQPELRSTVTGPRLDVPLVGYASFMVLACR